MTRHHREYADFFTDFDIPWYERAPAGAALPFMAIAALFGCEPEEKSSSENDNREPYCSVDMGYYQAACDGDADGDGVRNADDLCPTVEGYNSPKYKGCPPPDSDEDGLNDEEDRCPNTPEPTEGEVLMAKL